MRVGLVVRGGVDRSGRERVIPAILSLVERLARRHDLHVFALHHEPEPCTYPLLGATVHDLGRVRAPGGFRRRAQFARLTAALDRLGGFGLLHAYWALPAGLVATAAARRLRIPSVVTCDSGEWASIPEIGYGLQRRWIDRRAVRATLRHATRVTVSSGYMAQLAARHQVPAEIVPLGVPQPIGPAVDRPDGPPWRLLHVASINPVKDHPTLLNAFAAVVRRLPDAHLDVVGEDTLDGAVQLLTRNLGLASRVTFHGFQPADRLAGFHARAHLHVVSSRHEAAGVVTLEAAAAGLPTVGTKVGYVADWAADGDRAVAVPVGDPAALGAAIVDLIHDRPRRLRIAAAARTWALAHDADWSAAQFTRIYRELASVD